MDAPQLSPAHRELHRLVGEWHGDEQLHPTPFDPAGGRALSNIRNRLGLDGFAVVQEYEQTRADRPVFLGHGVFRYDPMAEVCLLYWFDAFSNRTVEFEGGFAGDTLTLLHRAPQGQVRATWNFVGADRLEYEMEMSGDGKSWVRYLSGNYSRVE